MSEKPNLATRLGLLWTWLDHLHAPKVSQDRLNTIDEALARIAELEALLRECGEVLEFYRDSWWNEAWPGDDPKLSPNSELYADKGDRARTLAAKIKETLDG